MTEDSSRVDSESAADEYEPALPTSRSFELLSTRRRRKALGLLREHGHVTLPDIAEAVAVRQLGKDITEIDPEEVTDTYMMLYHSDIPKLEDEDVVVYDQEQDIVATGENFDTIAELLAQTSEN